MRWIIDGNNVMGTRPDGWWRDRAGAQDRLLARLDRWAEAAGEDAVVVFDGAPRDEPGPGAVEAVWARRRGRDAADDVIVARVREDPVPGSLCVVTSDAGLAARARGAGAEVQGARRFLGRIGWA